jgi:hypothetical protein
VCQGATVGAGCRIGSGLTIGRFAMVGMGSVVTRSVPDFHLVLGSPARPAGCVCRCGEPLLHFEDRRVSDVEGLVCKACRLRYAVRRGSVIELSPPACRGREPMGILR